MPEQHVLQPVRDGHFVQLLAKHEPEIRAFIRASLPSPHDVAEVMQNVGLVAWRKFAELENADADFARWTCVIARFEIMKFRRGLARDRFVLQNEIVETLCEEGEAETEVRAEQIQMLKRCLQQLPQRTARVHDSGLQSRRNDPRACSPPWSKTGRNVPVDETDSG